MVTLLKHEIQTYHSIKKKTYYSSRDHQFLLVNAPSKTLLGNFLQQQSGPQIEYATGRCSSITNSITDSEKRYSTKNVDSNKHHKLQRCLRSKLLVYNQIYK